MSPLSGLVENLRHTHSQIIIYLESSILSELFRFYSSQWPSDNLWGTIQPAYSWSSSLGHDRI